MCKFSLRFYSKSIELEKMLRKVELYVQHDHIKCNVVV